MEARDSFCFPKKTKNPNPSPIEKRFGFSILAAGFPIDIPTGWEPQAKQSRTVALLTALRAAALFKSSYPRLLLKGNCRVKQKRQWTVCLPIDIPTGWEPQAKQSRTVALLTALRAAALFKSSYPLSLLKGTHYAKQKRQLSKAVFLVVRIRGLEPPPSCPD